MHILLVEDGRDIVSALKADLNGHEIYCINTNPEITPPPSALTYRLALLDYELPNSNSALLGELLLNTGIVNTVIYKINEGIYEILSRVSIEVPAGYHREVFSSEKMTSILAGVQKAAYKRKITIGNTTFDDSHSHISPEGRELLLRPLEHKIAYILALAHPKRVKETELIENVWGDNIYFSNTLNVHITRLRRQLERQASNVMIDNLRGFGYKLHAPHPSEPDVTS